MFGITSSFTPLLFITCGIAEHSMFSFIWSTLVFQRFGPCFQTVQGLTTLFDSVQKDYIFFKHKQMLRKCVVDVLKSKIIWNIFKTRQYRIVMYDVRVAPETLTQRCDLQCEITAVNTLVNQRFDPSKTFSTEFFVFSAIITVSWVCLARVKWTAEIEACLDKAWHIFFKYF